jgi:hypothetical protein
MISDKGKICVVWTLIESRQSNQLKNSRQKLQSPKTAVEESESTFGPNQTIALDRTTTFVKIVPRQQVFPKSLTLVAALRCQRAQRLHPWPNWSSMEHTLQ